MKTFSPQTLEKFEAAAASVPLRPLDRAFEGANIRLGKDPGGPEGARRVQFRRYVASVDQRDPKQLNLLGKALGALIDEVAMSKQEFLVKAAEHDGFAFSDGMFRPASTEPESFAFARIEDLSSIDERARRLHVLAGENPYAAIAAAKELVASAARIASSLELAPAGVNACLQQLSAAVASIDELRGKRSALSARHARLAAGAAVAYAVFIAETSTDRSPT